jgi:hypothetical protein
MSPRPGEAAGIDDAWRRMLSLLAELEAAGSPMRHFLGTYARTTRAIRDAVLGGLFEDPEWVDHWDVVFADHYLDAVTAYHRDVGSTPEPWRRAFESRADLPPVGHVLLGMNAHVNYDLPQSLLTVIAPEDFADAGLMACRHRDHERVDDVLATRVAAEGGELAAAEPARRTLVDRVMTPVNRRAVRRFLTESRHKVWHNTQALHAARLAGPPVYATRLAELERLSSARIADLGKPGPVLVRLALTGFGVVLDSSR